MSYKHLIMNLSVDKAQAEPDVELFNSILSKYGITAELHTYEVTEGRFITQLSVTIDHDTFDRYAKRGAGRKPAKSIKIDYDPTVKEVQDWLDEGKTHSWIIEKCGWARATYFRAWRNRDNTSVETKLSWLLFNDSL